jgi:hypothetical protein
VDSLDNILQVRLKQGHDVILQLVEFLYVAFTAEYVVPDLCKAGSGRETYVARADN